MSACSFSQLTHFPEQARESLEDVVKTQNLAPGGFTPCQTTTGQFGHVSTGVAWTIAQCVTL